MGTSGLELERMDDSMALQSRKIIRVGGFEKLKVTQSFVRLEGSKESKALQSQRLCKVESWSESNIL